MVENPFGDDTPDSDKRNYLILISASKDNAALAQKLLKNIQTHLDQRAPPFGSTPRESAFSSAPT